MFLIESRKPKPLGLLKKIMGKRRKARELALEILFMIDVTKQSLNEAKETYLDLQKKSQEIKGFSLELAEGVIGKREDLDNIISKTAKNWKISRMSIVDRNILRLAIYEILFHEGLSPKVIINEAIEIAKKYSTEDSGSFINGILDKVMKQS